MPYRYFTRLKNLEDKGNYLDPYEVAVKLEKAIREHIQDPLLREAYKTAIQHYLQTHPQIPRDQRYLQVILEKERELEEKLKALQHGENKLTNFEIKRIANLYRTLMLLTPHLTLQETKRFYKEFYKDLAERMKIKVGNEELLPVHGPVAEDIATSYSSIRKAPSEERAEIVRREISEFEPLLYITPHIEKR